MDVMGPTLQEVAEAFTATIPYNGHLIITDDQFRSYYEAIATSAIRKSLSPIIVKSQRPILNNLIIWFSQIMPRLL